jgi:AraC-like DNA-binding protein
MLCRLCRHYTTDHPNSDRGAISPPVKQALAYIRGHLDEPLSLDVVARQLNVSKSHLAREFKAFTGQTVVQAINLIRCTRAQQMIENGVLVTQAAAACGYENLSYFSRTFKKLMGHLPSHSKNTPE